jgi:hypothetical protein
MPGMFADTHGRWFAVLSNNIVTGEIAFSPDGVTFYAPPLSSSGGTYANEGTQAIVGIDNNYKSLWREGLSHHLEYLAVPSANIYLIINGGSFYLPQPVPLIDRQNVILPPS